MTKLIAAIIGFVAGAAMAAILILTLWNIDSNKAQESYTKLTLKYEQLQTERDALQEELDTTKASLEALENAAKITENVDLSEVDDILQNFDINKMMEDALAVQ